MRVLLRNVRLVNLDSGLSDEQESDLSIEDGRFNEIAPANSLPSDAAQTIDCGGRFALPGLIDCHCHMTGIFLSEVPSTARLAGHVRWIPKQLDLNFKAQLESGVTTVRDMMAPLKLILHMRSRSENLKNRYPRLLCSGPMLTVPGGYPPHVPSDTTIGRALLGPLRVDLKDREEATGWVDRLHRAGVDCIKIGYSTRNYDDEGSPLNTLSKELFKATVIRANNHDLPVAVHHSWLTDLEQLIDLPFDTLEHLTLDYDVPESIIDRIAERKLPVTTNLESFAFLGKANEHLARLSGGDVPLLPTPKNSLENMLQEIIAGRPPNPNFGLNTLAGAASQMARNLKRFSDKGVLIGAATDAGTNLLFGSLPDEICHMARSGLSPATALRTATSDAARILQLPDLGRIAPGFKADLVLYDKDPVADIECLRSPALVMRDGVPLVGSFNETDGR